MDVERKGLRWVEIPGRMKIELIEEERTIPGFFGGRVIGEKTYTRYIVRFGIYEIRTGDRDTAEKIFDAVVLTMAAEFAKAARGYIDFSTVWPKPRGEERGEVPNQAV